MSITPDTKDWTWVVDRPCEECGFNAHDFERSMFPSAIRDNASKWPELLARPDVARRPRPEKWSVLEYACHVRDVYRVFATRLALMLAETNPTFENWDQDESAVRDRYGEQDPATVARELVEAAHVYADRFATVGEDDWSRPGTRSNGSTFTVQSLGIYGLHDPYHHLWDVTQS